jgi:hypothetical protein
MFEESERPCMGLRRHMTAFELKNGSGFSEYGSETLQERPSYGSGFSKKPGFKFVFSKYGYETLPITLNLWWMG